MTSAEFRDRLNARAELAAIAVQPPLMDKLEAYFQLLSIWNRRINLTGLDLDRLPPEAIDRLFIEPIAAAGYAIQGGPVMDIGTGGGSPAIPFALASDASELTMIEARTRKSVFLKEAAHTLGIRGARVLTARFEDASRAGEFGEQFTAVTARAVRLQEKDYPALLDVLKPGGSFFFLHQREIGDAERRGSSARKICDLTATASVSIWTKPSSAIKASIKNTDVPRGTFGVP